MDTIFNTANTATERLEMSSKPSFFRILKQEDKQRLESLIARNSDILFYDTIFDQLFELVKIENANTKLTSQQSNTLITKRLNGRTLSEYGVWVYYPWSRRIVHLLDSEEFGKVRTNRNNYKITPDEQDLLYTKIVGIIGLSIGHSIAMTLATERSIGELRLADYDLMELSNLNRIQTSTHNIGMNKSIIAARAVAEIDPFINVRTYRGGVSEGNMDDFLTDSGKLDLLVEVCDGLDIKVLARQRARAFRIPVIMDTSDKGMIDIERFDIEPDRLLLHGLLGDIDSSSLKNLTTKEKIPFVVKMINSEEISKRLKASFIEVDQTISSWPQLASAVALGGAVGADTCRKILLGADVKSGRYYVDLDKLISVNGNDLPQQSIQIAVPDTAPYNFYEFQRKVDQFDYNLVKSRLVLDNTQIKILCEAALQAPSGGNSQPWKWIVRKSVFFLFYDQKRSTSWLDFDNLGLHIALGAAMENISLKALEMDIKSDILYFPFGSDSKLVAAISFSRPEHTGDLPRFRGLAKYIHVRNTNRNQGERHLLPSGIYIGMEEIVRSVPGCDIQIVDNEDQLDMLGELLSACDRIRLLTEEAHSDFYREIRWSSDEARSTGDGVEAELLDLAVEDLVGLKVAEDWESMKMIKDWDKGKGLQKITRNSIKSASAIAMISVSSQQVQDFIEAGRCIERVWLHITRLGLAVHPMYTIVPLLQRIRTGNVTDFSSDVQNELSEINKKFEKLFRLDSDTRCVFLLKISIAHTVLKKASRLSFDQVFYLEEE